MALRRLDGCVPCEAAAGGLNASESPRSYGQGGGCRFCAVDVEKRQAIGGEKEHSRLHKKRYYRSGGGVLPEGLKPESMFSAHKGNREGGISHVVVRRQDGTEYVLHAMLDDANADKRAEKFNRTHTDETAKVDRMSAEAIALLKDDE